MVREFYLFYQYRLRHFFSYREREDRQAIKKEDFILDKLKDVTIYRLPGSVNGQQFIGKIRIEKKI